MRAEFWEGQAVSQERAAEDPALTYQLHIGARSIGHLLSTLPSTLLCTLCPQQTVLICLQCCVLSNKETLNTRQHGKLFGFDFSFFWASFHPCLATEPSPQLPRTPGLLQGPTQGSHYLSWAQASRQEEEGQSGSRRDIGTEPFGSMCCCFIPSW